MFLLRFIWAVVHALFAWEPAGFMSSNEASAWRERIAIWRRFRRVGRPQASIPGAAPLLDDPDPFLSKRQRLALMS